MTDIEDRPRAATGMQPASAFSRILVEISRRLERVGLETRPLLDEIARCAAELIGEVCVIRLLSEDGESLVRLASHHPDPERAAWLKANASILSASGYEPLRGLVTTGTPLLLPEITPPTQKALARGVRTALYPHAVTAMLVMPMRLDGQLIGTLCVWREAHGRSYSEQDQEILQELTDRAALAIHNSRLFGSVRDQREQLRALGARLEEARESERRHLALELHDELSQSLSALVLELGAARAALPPDHRANAVLEQAEAHAGSILDAVRRIMCNLRPLSLDELGLAAALQRLGDELGRRSGLAVDMDLACADRDLNAVLQTAVFRIAQEALRNAERHAQARHLRVELVAETGRVRLVIEDDGRGLPPNVAQALQGGAVDAHDNAGIGTERFGLLGMRERAASFGGHLSVCPRPGGGTRVKVDIPSGEVAPALRAQDRSV